MKIHGQENTNARWIYRVRFKRGGINLK